ncbi:MAG: hypothetical protein HY040_08925 [Planctomycetes bacterium]|nr:hypothetical protein [Planctomycetota bacterium]
MSAFYCKDSALETIKTRFVPVALDGYLRGNTAERAFFKAVGDNNFQYLSASGKPLGGKVEMFNLRNMTRALEEFKSLPEADRKPKVERPEGISEDGRIPSPPPGCMIVIVYTTYLDRDAKGELSRAKVSFADIYNGSSNPVRPAPTNYEMLWITEAEWNAMAPRSAKVGDKLPFPASLQRRILLFHAQDYKSTDRTPTSQIRAGALTLTVVKATSESIELRLDGFAKTGNLLDDYLEAPSKTGQGGHGDGKQGAELRFEGSLHFDLTKKVFTRFDVVALGEAWGEFTNRHRGAGMNGKPRSWPIGIAFELVAGDRPVDRVPPRAACKYRTFDYFGTGAFGAAK